MAWCMAWHGVAAVQATNQPGNHAMPCQLFTPAWHVPLWSDRSSPFQVLSMSAAKLDCSALLAVGITPTTTAGFQKASPLYQRNLLGGRFISEDPLHGGVRWS